MLALFVGNAFADGMTLPPDPRDSGKKIFLGIDSDIDDVRDDIQRYFI